MKTKLFSLLNCPLLYCLLSTTGFFLPFSAVFCAYSSKLCTNPGLILLKSWGIFSQPVVGEPASPWMLPIQGAPPEGMERVQEAIQRERALGPRLLSCWKSERWMKGQRPDFFLI